MEKNGTNKDAASIHPLADPHAVTGGEKERRLGSDQSPRARGRRIHLRASRRRRRMRGYKQCDANCVDGKINLKITKFFIV